MLNLSLSLNMDRVDFEWIFAYRNWFGMASYFKFQRNRQGDKRGQKKPKKISCGFVFSKKKQFVLPAVLCCLKATIFYGLTKSLEHSRFKHKATVLWIFLQSLESSGNKLINLNTGQSTIKNCGDAVGTTQTTHSSASILSCSNCCVDLQMTTSLQISDCIYVIPEEKRIFNCLSDITKL